MMKNKTMKTLFNLSILALLICSCSVSTKKTVFKLDDQYIELKICTNTSKSELEHIAAELKSRKGIVFDFEKTTFCSDGTIDLLQFTIKTPEGYQARAVKDLYMSDDYYGFIRDYSYKSPHPLRCGDL